MTFRWMREARELFERWRDVERTGAAAGALAVHERMAFEVIEDEREAAVNKAVGVPGTEEDDGR